VKIDIVECPLDDLVNLNNQNISQHRYLFSEIFWWQAIAEASGYKVTYMKAKTKADILAIFPFFHHSVYFIKRIGIPLKGMFTSYIKPVLLSENIEEEVIYQHIIEYLSSITSVNYKEFSVSHDYKYGQKLIPNKFNWVKEKKLTFVLDLLDNEKLAWDFLKGRARNMIRKAEKNDIQVTRKKMKKQELKTFYKMLEVTFSKSGKKPPHSFLFYERLIQSLGENILLLCAKKDGEPVAYGFFPFNDYEIRYLSGTSNSIGNKMAASSLIQWEVIKFAISNKIKRYDMGGGGISSIDKFKLSFGSHEEFFYNYLSISYFVKLILSVYHRFKQIIYRFRF
jgi:hypothetical protein